MAIIFPRLQSLHWKITNDFTVDNAALWQEFKDKFNTPNDYPVYNYGMMTTDEPQFQIADDTIATSDFRLPFPVQIMNDDGTEEGTYVGWLTGERPAATGWFTYTMDNLADIFALGFENFYLIAYPRAVVSSALTDYDNLTFDTDTADYVTGPSHTASWENVIVQAGAGSCQIDISATPISGDELILELPAALSLTSTRVYAIEGWVYVSGATPAPGKSIGFNPRENYLNAEILDAKVWTDGVDPINTWVKIYTVFKPITLPGTQNVGLYFLDNPTGLISDWDITGNSIAGTIYTDSWAFGEMTPVGSIGQTERACLSEGVWPVNEMKVIFTNTEGSAFGCDFDGTSFVPFIRVPGNYRSFEFDYRDPTSETDSDGTSALPSVQIRKKRTVKAGWMPEWLVEIMAIGMASEYVNITMGGSLYSGRLVSTGAEPDISEDERGCLFKIEHEMFVLVYPWGTKN